MITVTQYFHYPNNTELGKGNTHECYLLVPNTYDLSRIFPDGKEVEVTDVSSKKKYYLRSAWGREFRINQMGQFYRDYDVHMGDEIILTFVEGEDSRTYISVHRYNRLVIKQGRNGAEIINLERLTSYKHGEIYEIPIVWAEQELTLQIQYKEALAKRSDSPDLTDYYTVKLGNSILQNGSFFLTLGSKNELTTFEKTDMRVFPFDESIISNSTILKRKTITNPSEDNSSYLPYLTALRTKPFMLLAGISGTGKSRIVREMAKACWTPEEDEYGKNCPRNFCMVQVKPNWHDSSDLIGYVSRINGEKYVVGPFLRFIAKAIKDPKRPYFLCLDEMNLAPVEQYFAEYLSVIESRKLQDGHIETDPIVPYENTEAYGSLIDQLFDSDEERKAYKTEEGGKRLTIPENLFVVGTVNMDETTFSFSRKVLDRAMTIEMNEVNLHGGLEAGGAAEFGYIGEDLMGDAAEGKDIYADNQALCEDVIAYLGKVNEILEGTPFKIAYRTRNEFLLYAVNRLHFAPESEVWQTLDEMTSMKILSRIEGDNERCERVLRELKNLLTETVSNHAEDSASLKKIDEMLAKLKSGYTSYWA